MSKPLPGHYQYIIMMNKWMELVDRGEHRKAEILYNKASKLREYLA